MVGKTQQERANITEVELLEFCVVNKPQLYSSQIQVKVMETQFADDEALYATSQGAFELVAV